MATKKKVSGIGAVDRKIDATRKAISAVKRKAAAEKAAKKKAATLTKLQNELKRTKKTPARKRR